MFSSSTDKIRILYSFDCENCNKHHSRTYTVPGVTEVGLSPESAQKKAFNSIRKAVGKLKVAADSGDFYWVSPEPCPDCGYSQSWQRQAQKSVTRFITIILFILLVLDMACISGLILGTPEPLAWLIVAFLLVLTGLFLRSLILMKRRHRQTPRLNQSAHPQVEWPNLL